MVVVVVVVAVASAAPSAQVKFLLTDRRPNLPFVKNVVMAL